ncbi:MAG: 2-isopropylmalate synthase [Clostridiales bacterium]|nr:2-isopropylmalate synthase [Clostridiales bacterium]
MSYYKKGAWWASPYNDEDEVIGQITRGQAVEIHDATLRDGEQTPGVVFTKDDKVRIAELLDEVGVERIEAGMPAVSQMDYDAIKEISKRNLNARIYAFTRAMRKDVDMAVDCGADGVVVEVPIGYPKLKYQFGWTWENVLEKSIDCINYAKSQGLAVTYFPYDTTRSRFEDLENLMKGIMQDAVPTSVGVVDTMGCAMPQTIQYLVRKMTELTNGLPVEVHTHNDFGMAVATELAGVAAGASCVHSCINGLGERTGNAALEELMMCMKVLMGLPNNYKLEKLMTLCKEVERISGVPLAPNKPVAGTRNYTRESGIGVDLVIKNPLAMYATNPAYFSREGDIVLGKKSGKASVEYYLEQLNISASEGQVADILERVKAKGIEKRGLLTMEEFQSIVSVVL